MAGFEGNIAAIWASVAVGVVNLLATVVSVYFVDRIGRRRLFFTGLTGIMLSLTFLGLCFLFHQNMGDTGKWASIALVFLYIAFFAISIGPLGWLIISEIFPQKVRGLGASIGSLSVWVFNAIVTFTFFKIVNAFTFKGTEIVVEGEKLGNPAGAFFLYAVIAGCALVWGYYYLPETKGVSLENIESFWRKGGKPRLLKNK
jgi:MFS family permease